MVASNELDANYFVETAEILFKLIVEISQKLKIKFDLSISAAEWASLTSRNKNA